MIRALAVCLLVWLVAGCGGDEPLEPIDTEDRKAAEFQATIDKFDLRPLPDTPCPPDNPRNLERIALGKLLFFGAEASVRP